MKLPEILSSFSNGKISQSEAEQLILNLPQTIKPKRGRPPKDSLDVQKKRRVGRPKKISTHERMVAMMTAKIVLDLHYPKVPAMVKRKWLSDLFCVGTKTIDTVITELNGRIANNEVWICHETKEVSFIKPEHTLSSFFAEVLDREPNVVFRGLEIKNYVKKRNGFLKNSGKMR